MISTSISLFIFSFPRATLPNKTIISDFGTILAIFFFNSSLKLVSVAKRFFKCKTSLLLGFSVIRLAVPCFSIRMRFISCRSGRDFKTGVWELWASRANSLTVNRLIGYVDRTRSIFILTLLPSTVSQKLWINMVLNDSNWNLNSPFIYKDYGRTFLSSKLLFLTTVILGITLPEKHEANGSPSLAFC